MYRNKGFTLIELMAVVAILSILLVVALASYSDYVIRAKVGEGMVFAAEAKTAVSEYYYQRTNEWPADNEAAGLSLASSYSRYEYLEALTITDTPQPGTILVTFDLPGTAADGKQIQLIPSTEGGLISWTCTSPDDNTLEISQRPANCRGN